MGTRYRLARDQCARALQPAKPAGVFRARINAGEGKRMNYEEACEASAISQGLGPVMERLESEQIEYRLDHGGFTMVIFVDAYNDLRMGITEEGGSFLLCLYDDDYEWIEETATYLPSMDDVIACIRETRGCGDRSTAIETFNSHNRGELDA